MLPRLVLSWGVPVISAYRMSPCCSIRSGLLLNSQYRLPIVSDCRRYDVRREGNNSPPMSNLKRQKFASGTENAEHLTSMLQLFIGLTRTPI
jgi:hypothetical protein